LIHLAPVLHPLLIEARRSGAERISGGLTEKSFVTKMDGRKLYKLLYSLLNWLTYFPVESPARLETSARVETASRRFKFTRQTADHEKRAERGPFSSRISFSLEMAGRKQADEYVGERNAAGQCEGRGTYKFVSGSVYKGVCKANNKEGDGTYTWKEGDVYDGEYKADNKEGRGTYTWKEGDVYEGEWKANKMETNNKERHGTYKFASGSVYKGEFKDNKSEGQGISTYANKDVYEGEYKADNKEGRGIYRWKEGDVYEGEWKADKMEGQGTYLYASGNIEVGFYKAGKGVGESVKWTADERSAWEMQDGKEVKTISNEEAERNVERLKLPMPVRREGKWAAGQRG
jgi:hypothetical protein